MILRFYNYKTGKILAVDFGKKVYEYCGYYTGTILSEKSHLRTHLSRVYADCDLKNIEQELRENGFKEQYKGENGELCLK